MFSQKWHLYFFGGSVETLCTFFRCSDSDDENRNRLSHSAHLRGNSPVWIVSCSWNWRKHNNSIIELNFQMIDWFVSEHLPSIYLWSKILCCTWSTCNDTFAPCYDVPNANESNAVTLSYCRYCTEGIAREAFEYVSVSYVCRCNVCSGTFKAITIEKNAKCILI